MSAALDGATSGLLAASLRELLRDGRDLAPALAELGWAEVLAGDPAGATTLLFVEHGRALATSRSLDSVVLAELDEALPVAAGTRAVLHPLGPPSPADGRVRGVLLGPVDAIDEVVVPVGHPPALLVVPAGRLARGTPADRGFDRGSGWFMVDTPRPGHLEPLPAPAWPRAVAAAHRALAAEIIGVGEAALTAAIAHTTARHQFGRPVASFQAVRHRLAEAHVALTAARAVLDAAWADGGAWAAALAKLQAGRAQAAVMGTAVQVSGAMGLAEEGEMHPFVTRADGLDALYGGHVALGCSTGAALLSGAPLEPVVEV